MFNMKMNVSFFCLTFFLISGLFSSTFFIIAASEHGEKLENSNPQASIPGNQDSGLITLADDIKNDNSVHSSQRQPSFSSEQKETKVNEIHSSFEEVRGNGGEHSEAAPELDSLQENFRGESLSISNVISETTQTLSFTLVDTAPPSLQHSAESISASRKVSKVTLAEGKDENITASVPTEGPRVPLPQSAVPEAADDATDAAEGRQATQNYVVRAEPKVVTASAEDRTDQVQPERDAEEEEAASAAAPRGRVDVDEAEAKAAEVTDALEVAEVRAEKAGEGSSNEDIPSFSEWAQKQLAEAEKKKVQNVSVLSASGNIKKLRSKNYASPDCGAKIIAVNPEAGSASSVLSPSRDEYMLNTCTSRIWFIVELCEAVQAKKIDLANFELFSSSPKEFTVFVSDRFPSRDWRSVGHFTALDERTVQSFDLHPHLFGKYIKVELQSHYGSEHFCPVSLFRVYGTSEFEVLETEDEVLERVPDIDDDDDEEPLDMLESGDVPKNLFGSARDAVLSIVKKAAEALGQSGSPENMTFSESFKPLVPVKVDDRSEWCCSPSHIAVCDNCSDALFGKVFTLLSCKRHYLQSLIDLPLVHEGIRKSELCAEYGLSFVQQKTGAPYPLRCRTNGADHGRYGRPGFLSSVFPPEYIAALCNVLAVAEKKVVLNVSHEIVDVLPVNLTVKLHNDSSPENTVFHEYLVSPQTTCTSGVEQASLLEQTVTSSVGPSVPLINEKSLEVDVESVALKIKPTRTLSKSGHHGGEFSDFGSVSLVDSTKIETIITNDVATADSTASAVVSSISPDNLSVTEPTPEPLGVRTPKIEAVSETPLHPEDGDGSAEVYTEEPDLSLDTLLSELKDLDIDTSSAASSVLSSISPPNVVQKESVFLRLSNRIKALERNMSLSGQYLEELSRRYKRQMEEMQRAFDRTLAVIAEESRKGTEREQKQAEVVEALQKQVAKLSSAVETLVTEQNSWQHKVFQPSSMVLLVLTVVVIYFTCRSQVPLPHDDGGSTSVKVRRPRRRKSAEGLMGHIASHLGKRRRPSEEALDILGTYKDLLITEPLTTEASGGKMTVATMDGKRKKRKKKDSTVKMLCAADEQKFRRRSDSSSVSPVSVVEGEVVPRRASFSDQLRSCSIPNERTIVCIDEQEGVEPPVEACDVSGGRIDYVAIADVDLSAGLCNSVNCIDSKMNTVSPSNVASVDIVVGGDERTHTLKNGSSRTLNGVSATQPRRLSSPSYMKTAVSARNSRKASSHSIPEPGQQAKLKSDNWRKLYRSSQLSLPSLPPLLRNGEGQTRTNGSTDSKEIHRFGSGMDMDREHSTKKVGGGGLKKMVRRFFE